MARLRSLIRATGTLALGGLCIAYIVWKIDLGETRARPRATRHAATSSLATAITIGAVIPLTWRWQRLLAARGVHEPLGWLHAHVLHVSFAFAQVLPDLARRRRNAHLRDVAPPPRLRRRRSTGSVLLERALGGFATLLLAAVGFLLAIGRYDVGAYLWIEAAILVASVAAVFVLFSRRARTTARALRRRCSARLRLERPLRAAYEGLHGYRSTAGCSPGRSR